MKAYAPRLLVLLAAAGCSTGVKAPASPVDGGAGGSNGYGRCSSDAQCQSGGCVGGICVLRATSFPTPLAVEISPALAGTHAALTELPTIPANWKLQTNSSVVAKAAFDVPDKARFPDSASVIVDVPALIPGRPSLSFENPIPPGETAFMIAVPSSVGDRAGTLGLIPLSPADAKVPPYRFSVPSVVRPTSLSIPTDVENQTPHGRLVDAFQNPKKTYSARAFVGDGTLVSNVAAMQDDGSFVLIIPSAVTGELSIELAPASSNDPWFTFKKMTLSAPNQALDPVTLPAYQVPQPVVFTVRSSDTSAPVAGAMLQASTILDPDTAPAPPGTTRFWQSATTSTTGDAILSLIPGSGQTPRRYDVVVVPPAGSAYASACVSQQPILGAGDTATIVVPLRPVISGTVASAPGTVIAGVTVTATRSSADAKVCSTSGSVIGPTGFMTTTDKSGAFSLAVDPGTYQLDFDPPSGSSAPRMTEDMVIVTAGTPHPVHLPEPVLIDGDVTDADEQPLPNAAIRIFEPRCATAEGCTQAPILRAQTKSDDMGHFRAVVARPTSN